MKLIGNGLKFTVAASALSLVVACGGSSEPTTTADEPPAASDVSDAAGDAADDVETAAADTADAAGDMAADAGEMASDAADDVADAAGEAAADVEEAAADAGDAVEEAAADAAHPRVSAETVAAYEALTGNAQNGRRVFTQCMACHSADEGRNMAGPSLYGIVGRPAGSIPGFNYSDANKNSGIVWTEPTMFAYLESPQTFIPGTIMAFPGLPKAQDRADVIAYLKQNAE